jgi:bifunctional DNA-binding transcriptional regulator/antitoxin component of YhaV-PrlF toxin-antitoxin module
VGSNSASTSRTRAIVKARKVAGSVVISLPASVRKPLGIEAGDKVLVEVGESHTGMCLECLIVTKE